MTATRLFDRTVIRLSAREGADESVADFLQGLVTSDVKSALPVWTGLLSPQGKALFDFLVWPAGDDILLDCESVAADALIKRLSMYRLRKPIEIARDESVAVHWRPHMGDAAAADPRLPALGERWIAPIDETDPEESEKGADAAWREHRLSLGVTEGRAELGDGETLWLECNAAELNGVSFTKGCFVGQENTARMNWRQKVNRRLVVAPLERSDEKRRRIAYPDLGLAVDYLRVADMDADLMPAWLVNAQPR
ncbi:CAF17-like 4Fe-4S cluster assembly/insertion protein YgfZ [Novosphingobium malaysiense]|uniref:Aminomethyltransferase n=1 Tax=Novosphingobium malaysiense TaxID=1348853 RepID=A0A0B1ZE81_9SPHN|nr:folate-binding protein YgfZ [Novosphingobium malaysiense]KHK89369.1 aminomethyltransferase [Novosphingobium malaysiense]